MCIHEHVHVVYKHYCGSAIGQCSIDVHVLFGTMLCWAKIIIIMYIHVEGEGEWEWEGRGG